MRVKTSSTGDGREPFDARAVRFVLVEPRSAGNVGAAARALKNLGFSRLVLVRSGCDPLGGEARRMAVDATDLLHRAESFDRLDAALDGAGTVVGTSRRKGKHRRPHYRLDRLAPELVGLTTSGQTAIVFGREDHGLRDAELDCCTHLAYLPASEVYPSFNLSQAVLLVAYELRRAALEPPCREPTDAPAGHVEREAMYRHLQQALLSIGFLHRENVEAIMRRFRRMLGRAALTPDEVQMLRGVARQVLWSAERAGLPQPSPEGGDGGACTERSRSETGSR